LWNEKQIADETLMSKIEELELSREQINQQNDLLSKGKETLLQFEANSSNLRINT